MQAETKYARSSGVHIVYQVVGQGPLDLAYVPGWVSQIGLMWKEPALTLSAPPRVILAVHIGPRVAVFAQASEVLVSSAAKDPVAGSGICFTDRGTRVMKGIPGEWRLLAAT